MTIKNTRLLLDAVFASCLVLSANAARQGEMDENGNYVITVGSGGEKTLNSDDIAALGTSVPLVKDGPGRLISSSDLGAAGYGGDVTVKAGYLRATTDNAFGANAQATLRIVSGAQLEVNYSPTAAKLWPGTIEFEGTGPDGSGALRYTGSSGQAQNFIGSAALLKMTGSATVSSGDYRADIRACTLIDMGGHTLTVAAGSGGFYLTMARVVNTGDIYVKSGMLGLESPVYFSDDATQSANTATNATITFANSTTLEVTGNIASMAGGIRQKFVTEGKAILTSGGWGSGDIVLSGDMKLGGNLEIRKGTADYRYVFNGKLEKAGALSGQLDTNGGNFLCTNPETRFGGLGWFRSRVGEFSAGWYGAFEQSRLFAAYPSVQTLTFSGTAAANFDNTHSIYIGWQDNNTVPGVASPTRGVMIIKDNAEVTNTTLVVGKKANTAGAILQRGGKFGINQANTTTVLGQDGDCYYELSQGECPTEQWFLVGKGGTGHGVLVQTGGKILSHQYDGLALASGAGARAAYLISGGEFRHSQKLMVCKSLWEGTPTGAQAVLTVDGTGWIHCLTPKGSTVFLGGMNNATGILNLNGGTLEMNYAKKMISNLDVHSSPGVTDPFAGNKAYVNFNGGTFKCAAGGMSEDDSCFATNIDRVTVYSKGAIVDTNGKYVNNHAPLLKPSGKGVKAIPFSCDTAWEYIGSPYVEITGDGTGASAIAEFDSETGKLTGIKVTSPGNDYTWAKATIAACGSAAGAQVVDCELEENDTTGGLIKRGIEQFCLWGKNTFEGPTIIEGGKIKLSANGTLDCTSGIVISNGASFFMYGKTCTAPVIGGAGMIEGVGSSSRLGSRYKILADDLKAGHYLDLRDVTFYLGDGSNVIEVVGGENLPEGRYPLFRVTTDAGRMTGFVPQLDAQSMGGKGNWKLKLSSDGRSLDLCAAKGMVLVVR